MNLQLNPNLTLYFLMISLIIGSFLNVIIYRLPRRLSFMKGFSYCPCCHHRLSSKELIPILSYLMLKGKCSYCHAVIAKRYPLIESLSLILMILCLIQADPLPERLLDYLFCCSLLCIAVIDIDTLEIDDRFHPWIIGLGFLHLTLSFHPYDRLIGFWLLFLPLALINRLFPSSIGGGDVKLACLLWLLSRQQYLTWRNDCIHPRWSMGNSTHPSKQSISQNADTSCSLFRNRLCNLLFIRSISI